MSSSFSGNTLAGLAAKMGAMTPVPVRFGWGWLGIGAGYLALDADQFRLSGQRGRTPVELAVPRSAVQAATFKRNRVLLKIARSAGSASALNWIDAEPKVADRFFAWLPDAVTKDPSIIGRWYETTLGPYRLRAWMSYLIALVLVGVFIWQGIDAGSWSSIAVPKLVSQGGNLAPLTLDGEPWRLLTAAFLHGGTDHLIGNLIAFLIVAPYLERLYGRSGLLGLFLAIGIIGSLADLWLNFRIVCVGASGSIFGLYGALFAYGLRRRGQLPMRSIYTVLVSAAFFLAWQIKAGFDSVGTNNAVHVTGATTGFVLGLLVAPPLSANWREVRQFGWALVIVALAVGLSIGALYQARQTDNWKLTALLEGFGERYEEVRLGCVQQLERAEAGGQPLGADYESSCVAPIGTLRTEVLALQPADPDLLGHQAELGQGLRTRQAFFAQRGLRQGTSLELAQIESRQAEALKTCAEIIDQLGTLETADLLLALRTRCQQPFDQLAGRIKALKNADPGFAELGAELEALTDARRDGLRQIAEAVTADDVEAFNRAVESIQTANSRYGKGKGAAD